MKQRIFTLIMMLALVIVTGSAFALNDISVYKGGTYSYKLNGIVLANAGTALINYAGDAAEVVQVTGGFAAATVTTVAGSSASFVAPAGSYSALFDVTFSSGATTGSANLQVTITDNAANGCSNFIVFSIEVFPLPTYVLDIVAVPGTYTTCQTRVGTGNNMPEVTEITTDEANTFTFTVTPTITGIIPGISYTYNYKISSADLVATLNQFNITSGPSGVELIYASETVTHTTSADPTTLTADVFTVTFNTTTGKAATNIAATLNTTAGNAVLTVSGGMTDDASFTHSTDLQVAGAIPSIGGFGL
jgi:hypothetical protein